MQDDPARRTKNKGLCFEVGAYIRGLEFRVLNESAMKLRQTTGMQKGCEAITAWKMSVCTSCCCNIGGVAGLVDNMMIVTLTKESAKDVDCSTWFIQMDKALRQYNYGINSCNGNSMKTVCCSNWTATTQPDSNRIIQPDLKKDYRDLSPDVACMRSNTDLVPKR